MPGPFLSAVVLFEDGWTLSDIEERFVGEFPQGILLVLPPHGTHDIDETALTALLKKVRLRKPSDAFYIASKHKDASAIASRAGWKHIDRLANLKKFVGEDHPQWQDIVRTFSPWYWRTTIRSQLQSIGLLSLPKIRIWIFAAVSVLVFLFVFFKLLPSATIRIWPYEETISQTVNVYLVSSGVNLPIDRIRTLPLIRESVEIERTMTFTEISKEFTGTNAEVAMTVVNDADETFSLRAGTRFTNQAGMVFKLLDAAIVPAGESQTVKARADDKDLYGEIIGERGNIPKGLKWEIPGLPEDQRRLVYGRNDDVGVGGKTSHALRLKQEDLEIAQKKLEQELLIAARQQMEEQRQMRNNLEKASYTELRYEELSRTELFHVDLPDEFIGKTVTSVPVSGAIRYTILLYDDEKLYALLQHELADIASADKRIVPESIKKENLVLHVIDAPWADPVIAWVKLTVDLSARQRFDLNPLSPTGAKFGKELRDSVLGKPIDEADSIIKNFPEVDKVSISVWPPWSDTLPDIASNIIIKQEL